MNDNISVASDIFAEHVIFLVLECHYMSSH